MHLELLGLRGQGVDEWTERSDGLPLGASHGCYFSAGKCDKSKGIIKIQLGVRAAVMRRPVQWAVGAFLMRKKIFSSIQQCVGLYPKCWEESWGGGCT